MNQRIVNQQYSFALKLANPVAFVLIVLPIADTLFGVLPTRFGQIRWRVATIGLISGSMLLPMLGLLLALTAAHALERRNLYRFLSVCSGLLGAVLLLSAVLFTLDALQLRGQITPETKRSYDYAGIKSVLTQLLQAGVFLAFTFTSIRFHRSTVRREAEQRRVLGGATPIVSPQ